ncbi:MAG TPA: class I SAM-dependent methyltransferase [Chloroflexota bacterium]|nr:class I SAM-dependent methyltransferase [Chloroflexota bacterium]
MSFYHRHVLPHVINLACGTKPVMRQRARIVPSAEGRVLEIGIGSGLNLPFYDSSRVRELVGLEPGSEIRRMAEHKAQGLPMPTRFLDAGAEAIPLEDGSIDTVVITYTLCTVPQAERAVREMRRVLNPKGRLLFSEHGLAPDRGVQKWQDRLNPLWKVIGGGCHLNRDIKTLIESGGFQIETVDTGYLPGPKPMTFNYLGSARPT